MAELTVRQQMAKGSKWKVREDFQAENHYASEFGYVPDPTPNYPNGRKEVQTKKKMTDFIAGEILTIDDKASMYHPRTYNKGLYIPIMCDRGGKPAYGVFEFKDISDKLELFEAVEQLIYVFHSPSKGGFIEMLTPHWYNEETRKKAEVIEAAGGILYNAKLTKALKKKRSQDAKMFLLSHSGYYDGIDTSDIYYVFEPGGKKVDFPEDLEIQTIDKATKLVKETFLAKDYLAEAFRLRPLTLKYGSSIRSVFKDMEEKGETYTTLLMFQDTSDDLYPEDKSAHIAELKVHFKEQKLKKGTYIMKSDYRTASFAFKNRNDALMFKLGYAGGLESKMVDADTLAEVSK